MKTIQRRGMIDYYNEISSALESYEQNKPYHVRDIDWICDRIDWCWKFRKITEEQMEELSTRATNVLDGTY